MRIIATVVAGSVAAALIAGCSSSGGATHASSTASSNVSSPASSLSGSITVFAASSLTATFTALGAAFEKANPGAKVTFSFGSSGDLSTQIDQGAPADVFASAAPKNMQTVITAGDATSSTNFVKNTAEIATAPGNPLHISTVADLAKGSTKVALCVVTAPCGALAQTILAKAGVKLTPTASEPDVKTTLSVVESGEVDAGIVYVSDVRGAGAKVTGVPIPADQNATTEYPIAALSHSSNPKLAAAFVAFIESPSSLAELEAAGFQAP
jgi:molybdate transport system substrate-binding protein